MPRRVRSALRVALALFVLPAACGGTSSRRDGGDGEPRAQGGDAGQTCTVQDEPDPALGDRCAGLDRLTVTDFGIAEEEDGRAFTATFELRDNSGFGFADYPGVIYGVQPPDTTLMPTTDFASYALHPCESMKSATRVGFGTTIGPGTTIVLTARAAALNQDCPNAPSSTISVLVVE